MGVEKNRSFLFAVIHDANIGEDIRVRAIAALDEICIAAGIPVHPATRANDYLRLAEIQSRR